MMVLHPVASTPSPSTTDSKGTTATAQRPNMRRRRVNTKGAIADYGGLVVKEEAPAIPASLSETTTATNTTSAVQSAATNMTTSITKKVPDIKPPKPCHAARLVLVCVQNCLRMGTRTQLSLCPPGRPRRELQALLRQQHQFQHRNHQLNAARRRALWSSNDSYYSVEKLLGDNYDSDDGYGGMLVDLDSDEDASSGDEEELCDLGLLQSEEPIQESLMVSEPLFTPIVTPVSKLPFNRRKIRFFDAITATEKTNARRYLEEQLRQAKKRSMILTARHLRRLQLEERRRAALEKGEPLEEDTLPEELDNKDLNVGISPIQVTMTRELAAALLIESLDINRVESIEGMSKCYDGIVAAGMALLEGNKSGNKRPTRAEILSALTPLLITSLEQPSGEVIVSLARLRRMCGTFRYQRRFVQRIAPFLLRPPRGAAWCLRHQNDMEALLASAELVFDSAFDIFSKGWYERGQLILADSKRAKTLDSAAKQLRSLTHDQQLQDNNKLGFAVPNNAWLSAKKRKEMNASNEALAEWEVAAVIRQIKVSITSVMRTDWSKVTSQADVPRPYRRGRRPSALSEPSIKAIPSSPRSPTRPLYSKTPLSPPGLPPNSTEAIENVFGSSFAAQLAASRATSPPPVDRSKSPPTPHRTNKEPRDESTSPKPPPSTALPKSPKSPVLEVVMRYPADMPQPPGSPKRAAGKIPTSTPLSPSSVGTSGSAELVSYRPSPVSSATSGNPANYRMLTSTAAERKRTVAACRALRAQIQRFEDAFIQLHGRPPKGNAERAPLASTYAQYREWKRAIRADAACRIQALLRGARTRSHLLRSNIPILSKILMKRPGRPGYNAGAGSTGLMNQIGLPVEIGNADGSSQELVHAGPALAPQWASTVVRRRSNNEFSVGTTSPGRRSYSPNDGGGSPPLSQNIINSADLVGVTLDELQAHKRELKRQLKQYDMNFARRHGRMPVKSEKEPIRHLYESYNALKSQITMLESGRARSSPPATMSPPPLRSDSPPSVSDSPSPSPSAGSVEGETTATSTSSSTLRTANGPIPAASRRRRVPRDGSAPPLASPSVASAGSVPSSAQDLAALKAEKSQLHQMLRSYERDFHEEHRRQVSSFSDIRPVASQYRRYKEIKRAIAALQSTLDAGSESSGAGGR